MDEAIKVVIGVFTGFVSLAIVSVIVSQRSQTPQVIQASASALSNVVAAAVNPVHTQNDNANLAVPQFGGIKTPQPGF